MRILLLTPQRPYPPHQGTTLRNFNVVRELSRRHDVCVLTFLEPDQDATDAGPLPDMCAWLETIPMPQRSLSTRLRQMLTTRRPDMGWRLWSPEFAARLAARLQAEPFNVVELEGIEMVPYLPTITAHAQNRPLLVYDAHNAEWILQRRAAQADWHKPRRWPAALYSSIQWRRLQQYEAAVMRQVDHTIAMSAPDAAALRHVAPDAALTIIPNGVDWHSYQAFQGEPIQYDVVFTGKMDFRPNIDAMLWFGEQVWPTIRAQCPEATCAIVGKRPHPRLDGLRHVPGITITGFVEDVRPYLLGAGVYVVPLRVGGGTRLKLIEAMACGKAIVSTTVGAEGFDITPGEHLILADTPIDFAQAVVALLNNPNRRANLGAAGQILAQNQYGWDVLIPQLEAVYKAGLSKKT